MRRIQQRLVEGLEKMGKPTAGAVFSPDELQSLGILTDQEIITLLRRYGSSESMDISINAIMGS